MLPRMADPASPPAPAPAPGGRGAASIVEPSRWQTAVARRSAEARATVPDLDLRVEVDAEALLGRRDELGCGLTALHARACALALREHPEANAAYRDGHFEHYERVNVGVLIAAPQAYAIPTLFDADTKTASELDAELSELETRAHAGSLLAPELSGATFTLSDLGSLGVAAGTPLIVPPQAAAVSAGAVRGVPVVRDGAIVPGHAMTLTLACDHRVLYGAAAAAFLMTLKSRLEEASL
jgi:pyruvate dehydrogenase E2 component (dihydrolipoamide acetyltransferase)